MRFWLLFAVLMGGCSDGPAVRLRAAYPEHAAAILAGAEGVDRPRANGMRAAFGAKGVVRFELADGFAVTVRESGVGPGGATFWTGTERGYEEWLLVEPPVDPQTPVAQWEVEGASLRRRGPDVEVVDDKGVARLVVRAPVGFAGKDKATLWLESTRTRVALHALPASGVKQQLLLDPSWRPVAVPPSIRMRHTASLLGSGRVLVAGGDYTPTTAELYDPVADAWVDGGDMGRAHTGHTATVLPSGKVLIAFGGNSTSISTETAELYDPVTNSWADGGSWYRVIGHTATMLPNGKVLVIGSSRSGVYDPPSNTWSEGSTPDGGDWPHYFQTVTQLSDGRLLVTARLPDLYNLYDPATDTWSAAARPAVDTQRHFAGLLPNGSVLKAGGSSPTSEIYDPGSNTWVDAGMLLQAHTMGAGLVLRDGRMLLSSGAAASADAGSVEIYDPDAGAWSAVHAEYHLVHTATQLQSGLVLITGGGTSELFDPTFGARCLAAADCLSGLCTDGVCCESSCVGACNVCNAPDARGTCVPVDAGSPGSPSCAPFLCGGASGACPVGCLLDAECAIGNFCGGGVCLSKSVLGVGCGASNSCLSGNCIDGVCCDTTCGNGNPADCQGCSLDAGAPSNGTCALLPPTTICRAQNGGCDEADHCPGNDAGCPIDLPLPAGTVCRAAAGFCDLPEVCNGIFGECPADALIDAGITCRLSAGTCDPAEVCSGLTPDCPPDVLVDAGVVCRPVLAVCDAEERCLGDRPACPIDRPAPDGTSCIKGGTCAGGVCQPPSGTGTGGGSGGQGGGGSAIIDAGPGPAPTGGCGCSSAADAIWLVLLLLPALRRRRCGAGSTAAGPGAPHP